jgi:hypothetical protein
MCILKSLTYAVGSQNMGIQPKDTGNAHPSIASVGDKGLLIHRALGVRDSSLKSFRSSSSALYRITNFTLEAGSATENSGIKPNSTESCSSTTIGDSDGCGTHRYTLSPEKQTAYIRAQYKKIQKIYRN